MQASNTRVPAKALFRPRVLGPTVDERNAPDLEHESEPFIRLKGVAADVTGPSIRRKTSQERYIRVGTPKLNVTTERWPGLPAAIQLKPGHCYEVEVFKCLVSSAQAPRLPRDKTIDGGLVFFNKAREVRTPDEEDQRRTRRGYGGVWTDGVMVVSSNQEAGSVLELGRFYKVVIRHLGQAQA